MIQRISVIMFRCELGLMVLIPKIFLSVIYQSMNTTTITLDTVHLFPSSLCNRGEAIHKTLSFYGISIWTDIKNTLYVPSDRFYACLINGIILIANGITHN